MPKRQRLKHARSTVVHWTSDLWIKIWHCRRFGALLLVDETGNEERGSGRPFFIGATGVVLFTAHERHFNRQVRLYRRTLPRGARRLEFHAAKWVPKQGRLKPLVPWQRIRALRGFMRACSTCPGVHVINVIADSTKPWTAGTNLREEVFRRLFLEFEQYLDAEKTTGLALVDRNQMAQVVNLHASMAQLLPRQPLRPLPVDSRRFPGVQLADVCAYFMLQQVAPNKYVQRASAQNAINDISALCPAPGNINVSRVHQV